MLKCWKMGPMNLSCDCVQCQWVILHDPMKKYLPLKRTANAQFLPQNERIVSQPSIFSGKNMRFWEVYLPRCTIQNEPNYEQIMVNMYYMESYGENLYISECMLQWWSIPTVGLLCLQKVGLRGRFCVDPPGTGREYQRAKLSVFFSNKSCCHAPHVPNLFANSMLAKENHN